MLSTSSCPWILEAEASRLVPFNPLPSTGFQSVPPDRICFCCFVFFLVFQGLTFSLQLLQPQTTGSPLHFSFVILFFFVSFAAISDIWPSLCHSSRQSFPEQSTQWTHGPFFFFFFPFLLCRISYCLKHDGANWYDDDDEPVEQICPQRPLWYWTLRVLFNVAHSIRFLRTTISLLAMDTGAFVPNLGSRLDNALSILSCWW